MEGGHQHSQRRSTHHPSPHCTSLPEMTGGQTVTLGLIFFSSSVVTIKEQNQQTFQNSQVRVPGSQSYQEKVKMQGVKDGGSLSFIW